MTDEARDQRAIAAICLAISGDEQRWGPVAIEILQGLPLTPEDEGDLCEHLRYHPDCPDGEYTTA